MGRGSCLVSDTCFNILTPYLTELSDRAEGGDEEAKWWLGELAEVCLKWEDTEWGQVRGADLPFLDGTPFGLVVARKG